VNGGIWPVHCVAGTNGAALDERFARDVKEKGNRPSKENVFLKGKDDFVEEYSAFNGETETGVALKDELTPHVYVAGIATEFCVKETVLAILAAGHSVTLLKRRSGPGGRKGPRGNAGGAGREKAWSFCNGNGEGRGRVRLYCPAHS